MSSFFYITTVVCLALSSCMVFYSASVYTSDLQALFSTWIHHSKLSTEDINLFSGPQWNMEFFLININCVFCPSGLKLYSVNLVGKVVIFVAATLNPQFYKTPFSKFWIQQHSTCTSPPNIRLLFL